nr:hypothetical protein [Salmonella enterica]
MKPPILAKAEESRLRSINVDDFEPEALATKPVKLPEKVRKVEAHNQSRVFPAPLSRGFFLPLFFIIAHATV